MMPSSALCAQPAVVWCKQDKAQLCPSCDRDTHGSNPLAGRQRSGLGELSERQVESGAAPELLNFDDTASSIPSLDALLTVEAAQFGDGGQVDLASLLSFDDPMTPLDFWGVDLSELQYQPHPAQPHAPWAGLHPAAAAVTAPKNVPSRPASSVGLICTTSSGDAVVPVLPPSPSSPQSPQSRVVTTGSHPVLGKLPASPGAPALVKASPGAAAQLMAVPSWVPSPPAAATAAAKPEPVTTAVGGGAQRKREAAPSFLPGAPRAMARVARIASESSAGLGGSIVTTAGAVPSSPDTSHACAPGMAPAAAVPYHIVCGGGYADTETRADKLARYRAKKARRTFAKKIRYQTRKDYAEVRPRIKGRFVSPEEYAAWKAQQDGPTGHNYVHVVPSVAGQ